MYSCIKYYKGASVTAFADFNEICQDTKPISVTSLITVVIVKVYIGPEKNGKRIGKSHVDLYIFGDEVFHQTNQCGTGNLIFFTSNFHLIAHFFFHQIHQMLGL